LTTALTTTDIAHEPQPCRGCSKPIDAATGVFTEKEVRPKPGDVTVCLYCGHLMVYREGLVLDDPSAEEMYQIAGDERILAIQRARGKVMKKVMGK